MRHLLIAAAATAMLVQSASAQTTDQAAAAQAAMERAVQAMGIKPSSAVTDKADAAMTTPNVPRPESDKKAAAAMSRTAASITIGTRGATISTTGNRAAPSGRMASLADSPNALRRRQVGPAR